MVPSESAPTLCFDASFPLDLQFAVTVADLVVRFAVSAGLDDAAADALGRSFEAAFTRALNGEPAGGDAAAAVSLCAGDGGIHVALTCGETSWLDEHLPRPR